MYDKGHHFIHKSTKNPSRVGRGTPHPTTTPTRRFAPRHMCVQRFYSQLRPWLYNVHFTICQYVSCITNITTGYTWWINHSTIIICHVCTFVYTVPVFYTYMTCVCTFLYTMPVFYTYMTCVCRLSLLNSFNHFYS